MNFDELTIAQKLRWLAELIVSRHCDVLDQSDVNDCVVGIGVRLSATTGDLAPADVLTGFDRIGSFARRYGVSWLEAEALFVANYKALNIGIESYSARYSDVTPAMARRVLYLLASKYDGKTL